jgi:hypothetical protein
VREQVLSLEFPTAGSLEVSIPVDFSSHLVHRSQDQDSILGIASFPVSCFVFASGSCCSRQSVPLVAAISCSRVHLLVLIFLLNPLVGGVQLPVTSFPVSSHKHQSDWFGCSRLAPAWICSLREWLHPCRSTPAALASFSSSHSDLFDLQLPVCSDVDSSRIGGIQHQFVIQVPGRCFSFLPEDFPLRYVAV